jgi:putative esterase
VVLQDNGKDNLSVSANGSFTFATPLAAGAAYGVTVLTNPAGQSCTVSSGSGTVGSANVTSVAVSCAATQGGSSASDNFSRANGPLGPNWTDTSDGGLAISSGAVIGIAGQNTGDMWTANTFASDQFSQVQVTSTQLSGGNWVGPAVRMQSGGQTAYVGIYYWNSGSPELMLFARNGGNWSQLGSYNSGALAAGTQLKLIAVGNTVVLQENGTQVIGVADSTITGGAPGIMASGNATAGAWSGGNAGFQVSSAGTSAGIASYNVISASNGYGPQTLRVVTPTHPAAGVAHNFLIVLPVEPGLGSQFGDGLATLQSLDAQDQYNVTMIEPTFYLDPWYANNATDPNLQYETFLTQELVPWIKQNLATTGHEQVWLIGFSKSGIGGQDLILKHPDVFTLAASWDAPFDISSYNEYSDSAASYGTDANFQANYRLTASFVAAHKAPFVSSNRIWIGGYGIYEGDDADYDALLTSQGIAHTTETPTDMAHAWTSGWLPIAMAALYQDSLGN